MRGNLRLLAGCLAVVVVSGGVAAGHGALDERLERVSGQIAAAPEDGRLHLQRANLLREHEDWSMALEACERAAALDPGLAVDPLRARILLESGRPGDALPLLDKVLLSRPDETECRVWRARAHRLLGHAAAAADDFRKALDRCAAPQPDLVQEAADTLAAEGASQEAVAVLDAGMAKIGVVPALMLRAIDLEVAAGSFPAALARIDRMQASGPRPEPWMAKRAAVLAVAGRTAESQAAWTALVTHLGGLPDAERGSNAMSRLREQAEQALAALRSLSPVVIQNP
jgi:predicted Zn-dependent protease